MPPMQRLELRQAQSLVMTPQLLQAIKLLQLSHQELQAYVEAELERNPLLNQEIAPDAPDGETGEAAADDTVAGADKDAEPEALITSLPSRETPSLPRTAGEAARPGENALDFAATIAAQTTLADHLERQLELATSDLHERAIGQYLIHSLDEAGYLRDDLAVIAVRLGAPREEVEAAVALIQTFDPPGVGARDLAECLAIQLKELDRYDPAMQALLTRLDLVAKRDFAALKRLCGVDDEDLAEMLAEIRLLEPKPGHAFAAPSSEFAAPDVLIREGPDGAWVIELNPDTLPRILVDQSYHARVSKAARSDEERAFLNECLQSANWLKRSLDQRAKTILKVASEIVRRQDGFFRHGVSHLRPLTLKAVADEIGMHESTISRVTANKSFSTGRGLFEMKYFFSVAINNASGAEAHSAEAVRHRIKQMIEGEPANDVLSDDAIAQKLKGEGIDIARRTVAKYRESLRIPSSADRRRLKKV
ncbi:RNA polymerase factor sigma-54 [Microvirga flavescens]|uniref:RNA polymerase factor sigma-54 n=1 Tax=Microvirga flavescens TaxID=2249811 RepID=UPI000DDC1289|nr:RNA polymerase factor sigma-54 [Microvirga flavescens]